MIQKFPVNRQKPPDHIRPRRRQISVVQNIHFPVIRFAEE
jgi:hypothetical protein